MADEISLKLAARGPRLLCIHPRVISRGLGAPGAFHPKQFEKPAFWWGHIVSRIRIQNVQEDHGMHSIPWDIFKMTVTENDQIQKQDFS